MQKTQYSRLYRIMHWAIALTFLLLLLTIFLRLTWMNKYNMAAIIQEFLSSTDLVLSSEQSIALAKKIRQPMWDWHVYLGYTLVALFSLRFILAGFGQLKIQNPLGKNLSIKVRFQKWVYLIFYLCVFISLSTGILIVWGPKAWKKPIEEIHELGIYYLIAFIVIHLAGALIAEFTDQKGIISRIISGKDEEAE